MPNQLPDLNCVMWAKKGTYNSELMWLPLTVHLNDAAETAARLYDTWLAESIKRTIIKGVTVNGADVNDDYIRKLLLFLVYVHDVGKATPAFQSRKSKPPSEIDGLLLNSIIDSGLKIYKLTNKEARHELVTFFILQRNGCNDSVSVIPGGHHGAPPESSAIQKFDKNAKYGFGDDQWSSIQDGFFQDALNYSSLSTTEISVTKISRPAQVLLSGILILCDWISSDNDLFPLISILKYSADSSERADDAFRKLDLTDKWEPGDDFDQLYNRRFGFTEERPIQSASAAISKLGPMLMLIEAMMGDGKTEAALVAVEILTHIYGCRGIFFALPTQATSNAMFSRILKWIKTFETGGAKYSVRLSHGKADLNENYAALPLSKNIILEEDGDNSAVVHEWLSGRKKGLLTDFTIGTVDQLLMAALKQKHLVLRHLGLAGKVVVIDEVHAYDVYMNSYLLKALNWLGAYKVPVIMLSATLTAGRRRELVDAYLNVSRKPKRTGVDNKDSVNQPEWVKTRAYPLITYMLGKEVHSYEIEDRKRERHVSVKRVKDADIAELLHNLLSQGGNVGVITNTVGRAQTIYQDIVDYFGAEKSRLLHARILACDRARIENEIVEKLGPADSPDAVNKMGPEDSPDVENKPRGNEIYIIVGTQVLEQSLDLDFDLLITDLCPMDLLLQRIGRLHRRSKYRPGALQNPVCFILNADYDDDFETGAKLIYGKYLLMRTKAFLPDEIVLPDDISQLVEAVYNNENDKIKTKISDFEDYINIQNEWLSKGRIRAAKAGDFQISEPICGTSTIINWLQNNVADASEKHGEAVVRDGADSVEVMVIRKVNNDLRFLPWIYDGAVISRETPDDILAKKITACSLRLPALFGGKWIVDEVIKELESDMVKEGLNTTWYKSPYLKGALCLILDENFNASLHGYKIKYDEKLGLIHKSESIS